MVELFRKARPVQELAWTGERFVTGIEGLIALEHLHRYFLARDICRGKHVLDVASGEGYGTALLAQVAASATGVEIVHEVVAHAALNYQAENLSYLQGAATALPMPDASIDAVVSFETLEHFADHDGFFAEVRRVLRPGGFLLISTPDPEVYSAWGTVPNPYHIRELTEVEFVKRLEADFKHVSLMRQRAFVGSAILANPARLWANPASHALMAHMSLNSATRRPLSSATCSCGRRTSWPLHRMIRRPRSMYRFTLKPAM